MKRTTSSDSIVCLIFRASSVTASSCGCEARGSFRPRAAPQAHRRRGGAGRGARGPRSARWSPSPGSGRRRLSGRPPRRWRLPETRLGEALRGVSLAPPCSASADELEEAAFVAARGLVLVQEREVLLVELLEPLVPRDLLERGLRATREVDSEKPGVVVAAGSLHRSRLPVASLRPTPDLVVIRRRLRFRHRDLLCFPS